MMSDTQDPVASPRQPASALWSPQLASLSPYVPGEQCNDSGWIKLNTNESPFGPSPKALEAMGKELTGQMRLYPDPDSRALKQAIARMHGLEASQVFVGNGSDEVLAHAFLAFFRQPEPILLPAITYSFYASYCALYGINSRRVRLTGDLQIDLDDYDHPNGGVVFPNPNAPTGRCLDRACIERMLKRNCNSVVLVDEAYVDFGAQSVVPLIAGHPNLLVVHTLSKSRSLAGLRVGFALGHPDLIAALERVKGSFNAYPLSRLAQAGAEAAILDRDYLSQVANETIWNRRQLSADLQELGFEVVPSLANFIFVRHALHRGADLCHRLKSRRILVRRFEQPGIEDYLRITIGTSEQCLALYCALRALVRDG
jgi:histidinol-phosphate aminotransferase